MKYSGYKYVKNITFIYYSGTRKKNVQGEVYLPIKIAQMGTYWPFLLVKGLNHSLLFGRDLTSKFNFQLNFKEATVTLENRSEIVNVPTCGVKMPVNDAGETMNETRIVNYFSYRPSTVEP